MGFIMTVVHHFEMGFVIGIGFLAGSTVYKMVVKK